MFKKIEIWVLYLVIVLSIIIAIGTGVLVRQELIGSVKFGVISKVALFLAEIPMNLKEMSQGAMKDSFVFRAEKQRFNGIAGFQGEPLEDEVYLLHVRYDGNLERSVVELVDLRLFAVKKTWSPDIDQINELVDTSRPEFKNLVRDYNLKKYMFEHPFLTEDGGLIFKSDESPLVKIDRNSQLVWLNQEDQYHHSIEQDHEGNFWVPSHLFPYQLDKKYVGSEYGNFSDDAITKVSPDGEILFQKSVSKIFIENNMEYLLFQTGQVFNDDPIHLNDIKPVLTDSQYWKRGDVFLSLRTKSMVILYRPSTNEIIWKGVGHTFAQHDVDILDNHRISIFNNNLKKFHGGDRLDGSNEVVIYDFKIDTYSKYFNESLIDNEVKTPTQGRSQILDNGDLFIEETDYGRTLYFSKDKSLQWQHVNRADDGKIYAVKWSRILYKPADIKKVQKILKTSKN